MKYPKLVRNAKTDIIITLYSDEIGECGEPIEILSQASFKCNYQNNARKVFSKDKEELQITGTAYFDGDISPECVDISSGVAVVFGVEYKIVQGQKARNPDGSVNYTELWLL